MDAHAISKAYLSISSPGTVLQPDSSEALTRHCNDEGAAVRRAHPSRFGHFASLPLPDVAASLAEIARCAAPDGPIGADGFALLSNAHGLYPGDAALAPVWDALDALGAVVFVHPTAPCTSACVAAARPGSPNGRRRVVQPLADAYPAPMLEFMFETTRAFADLLLAGVPGKWPRIRWIVPHAGAALPSVLDRECLFVCLFICLFVARGAAGVSPKSLGVEERLGHWLMGICLKTGVIGFAGVMGPKAGSPRGEMAALTGDGVREVLGRSFYFDLAGLGIGNTLPSVLRWVDHTRLLYGSDVPYTPWAASGELEERLRQVLVDHFGVETGAEEIRRVCRGNAEALLGKVD